jgi:Domain of unknown function (DUF3472)/Domain of unknown function (DUF5077)
MRLVYHRITIFIFSFLFVALINIGSYGQEVFIPVAGNTWVTNSTEDKIDQTGIKQWQDPKSTLATFFRVSKPGFVNVAILAHVATGKSSIRFSLNDQTTTISITNTILDTIKVGKFSILAAGYQQLIMQGLDKSASDFAKIEGTLISGSAIDKGLVYVKDDFYWGRRGPSVHLRYEIPENTGNVVWFYNEITVPEGEDVIGSYFMANGFAEGYFGIQVNSAKERRILFSVWSPYKTDDPGSIPEEYKIKLLAKGEGVHTGEFGNEGSGGQSYWRYMWQPGNTYRFLLKGVPAENNSTDYTAYFYAPELGKWLLLASFRRPKTSTYLQRPHSFLENFITETGYKSRRLYYGNQWVFDTENKWYELTEATFTADATARKGARLDYFGGVEGDRFFLKNCGFFNTSLEIGSKLTRKASGKSPEIDFSSLPY